VAVLSGAGGAGEALALGDTLGGLVGAEGVGVVGIVDVHPSTTSCIAVSARNPVRMRSPAGIQPM
jgi:hypothetical protein